MISKGMTFISPKGDFGVRSKPMLSVLYQFVLLAAGMESFNFFTKGRR